MKLLKNITCQFLATKCQMKKYIMSIVIITFIALCFNKVINIYE